MLEEKNKSCCIIVPLHLASLSYVEEFALKHIVEIFSPKRDIILVVPNALDISYYKNKSIFQYDFKIIRMDDSLFGTWQVYSKLCKSVALYEQLLNYDYFLIHHVDAWCFEDRLDYFMKLDYDYYGGPVTAGCWCEAEAVGNGGLSLRKTKSILDVLKNHYNETNDAYDVEDVWYSIKKKDYLNICPIDVALQFAFSSDTADAYKFWLKRTNGVLPMGIHNFYKHDAFDFCKKYIHIEIPPLNFCTFASSNWKESPIRFNKDLSEIEGISPGFFKKSFIMDEGWLGKEYNFRFSEYFYKDHGFAYFSWKPIVLLKALEQIKDGEMLFYIDGGCAFPTKDCTKLVQFIKDLSSTSESFYVSNSLFGLSYFTERPWKQFPGFPNATIVKREILEKFDLQNDNYFLYFYPHWQAGVILCRKDEATISFLKQWYQFFLDNYESCVRGKYEDRNRQSNMFIHNGSDQAILQCLLYKKNVKIFSMNFIYDYNLIQHIRK